MTSTADSSGCSRLSWPSAVLAALVWPLVRPRKQEAPGDEAAATAVFRDHKRQLDAEFAAGTLSAADRDAAQAELVARFGTELAVVPADVSSRRPSARAGSPPSCWSAVVPASAALLYALLGNPAAVNPPAAAAAAAGHGGGDVTDPQIVAMVDRLAEKMKANPDDGKGWVLLGRSYSQARPLRRFAWRPSRKPPSACRKTRACSPTRPRPSRWRRASGSPDVPPNC